MNNNHVFPILTLHFAITILFVLIVIPVSHCQDDDDYKFSICSSSYTYRCGSSKLNISYPFWGGDMPQYCGREGFEIKCHDDHQYHFIEFTRQKFIVLTINYESHPTMTVARDDLWNNYCPGNETQDTVVLDPHLFKYSPNVGNLSFFHCQEIPPQYTDYFNCSLDDEVITGFYTVSVPNLPLQNLPDTCQELEIKVPVLLTALEDLNRTGNLSEALNKGFEVEYLLGSTPCPACYLSGGKCGSNQSAPGQFLCYCPDREPQMSACPTPTPTPTSSPPGPDRGSNVRIKLALGIFAGLAGITFTCIIIICLFKSTKNELMTSTTIFRKREKIERDLEAFIRNYGSLAPTRYRYSDVKKMTNSFKDKIGQGGYGGVFKGKLQDGKLVAVKLLNTAKGNGEEFINEVASISRTSHVNVVMLLGFCLEGKKRALVYEFMANGSLEKFIHSIDTLTTNRHLGWEKLYQIALGIARGLEYLHRGCNTRILHFDIKPHNILLDEDFCPKISDFGLAKLCPRKESMVSMLEARGTIGYIAPEVFSRNFGEVSHKSDVYSYGMMILEMVGGRKNLHLGVENSSKIYFPKWVYRHFELGNELKLHDGMTKEENEIAKRMIIVGLWCIQARPLDRPSMNKVIDMLQGSIEALQIPSNPFLSSPPRSPVEDSSPLSFSRSTLDNDL